MSKSNTYQVKMLLILPFNFSFSISIFKSMNNLTSLLLLATAFVGLLASGLRALLAFSLLVMLLVGFLGGAPLLGNLLILLGAKDASENGGVTTDFVGFTLFASQTFHRHVVDLDHFLGGKETREETHFENRLESVAKYLKKYARLFKSAVSSDC